MLDDSDDSRDKEDRIEQINAELKCSKQKCKFYASWLSHLISSIEDVRRSTVYQALKKILLRYRDSLEEFENVSNKKNTYYQDELKAAESYIQRQDLLQGSTYNGISDEGRELYDLLYG